MHWGQMYPPDVLVLIRMAAVAGMVAWLAQVLGQVALALPN